MSEKLPPQSEEKSSVIRSVTTPLAFFALAMLVIEAVLVIIATRAAQKDLTAVLIISAALIVILVVIFCYVSFKNPYLLLNTQSVNRLNDMKVRIATLEAELESMRSGLEAANRKAEALQSENESLQQEIHKFSDLKLRILALLNRASSMSLYELMNDLKLEDNEANRTEVLSAIGALGNKIEGDGMRGGSYYKLVNERKAKMQRPNPGD
jgi:FtsZ-binding cell division protein ZapB